MIESFVPNPNEPEVSMKCENLEVAVNTLNLMIDSFCNLENQIAFLESESAIKMFMDLLNTNIMNTQIVRIGFRFFNLLCNSFSQAKVKFSDAGFCEFFMSTLTMNYQQQSKQIAEEVCSSIANMNSDFEDFAIRDKLVDVGAVEAVLNCLDFYTNIAEERICEQALKATAFLSRSNRVKIAISNRGLHLVVQPLMKFSQSEDICLFACWAIYNLACSNDDNKIGIGNIPGAFEGIVGALKRHIIGIPKVAAMACGAIRNLICDNYENKAMFAKIPGALEAIIDAVKIHIDNTEVVAEGLEAIGIFAKDNKRIQILIGNISDALNVIIDALRMHLNDECVAEFAFPAIYHLACDDSNKEKFLIGIPDALDIVVAAVRRHMDKDDNADIVGYGCKAILILLWSKKDREDIAFPADGIILGKYTGSDLLSVETVIDVIRRHGENAQLGLPVSSFKLVGRVECCAGSLQIILRYLNFILRSNLA